VELISSNIEAYAVFGEWHRLHLQHAGTKQQRMHPYGLTDARLGSDALSSSHFPPEALRRRSLDAMQPHQSDISFPRLSVQDTGCLSQMSEGYPSRVGAGHITLAVPTSTTLQPFRHPKTATCLPGITRYEHYTSGSYKPQQYHSWHTCSKGLFAICSASYGKVKFGG
jgi:hypothetical protein